jgi:hypothetical protein
MFTTTVLSKDSIVLRRFLELSIDIWRGSRDDLVEAYRRAVKIADKVPRIAVLEKQRKREFKDDARLVVLLEKFLGAAERRVSPGVQEFLGTFRGPTGRASGSSSGPIAISPLSPFLS